ncbi:MAG: SLC13/DASS family transporter [Deltaproteobacteria bacterium]|nr:SLC13/DASS family transporter [Deltaproteobacteria bacterium]
MPEKSARDLRGGWRGFDLRRAGFLLLGAALFAGVYLSPAWPDAVDAHGRVFVLGHEAKAAIALFLLALCWWMTEVLPIGVTSIAVAAGQGLFSIRDARTAFTDFMDPGVWFIFAALAIGMAFTKTGLTRRIAYRTLLLVGERTERILLGCLLLTMGLTLVMAHAAVAATVYPLFLAVHALYTDDDRPTRFGKALFIGMAFSAGAGSVITLLGSARAAVSVSFFRHFTGHTVGFFELSWYMLPIGLAMTLLVWLFLLLVFRPERKTIPGLRDRAKRLHASLGPISAREIRTLLVVGGAFVLFALRALVPALGGLDQSAILAGAALLLFVLNVLAIEDLEGTSWNIILMFGGATSIGLCLWETGAAHWLAVQWLATFDGAPGLVFVLSVAFVVLAMTNLTMNVAAISVSLPVALVIAPQLGVAPDVILYAILVAAGMPFVLLVGAAPNAIAYASRQFTAREFLLVGLPMTAVLLGVLALFVWAIWPAMGMAVAVR